MIRLSTILWLILVSAVGFGMFEVKYAVMGLEDTLARTNRAIVADQDGIHVLQAEWSYLSQPTRLEELAHRYLELGTVNTAQLGQIENLPMRPAALPPTAAPTTTLSPQVASGKPAIPSPAAKPAAAKPAAATPTVPSIATPSIATPAPATTQTRVAVAKLRTEP